MGRIERSALLLRTHPLLSANLGLRFQARKISRELLLAHHLRKRFAQLFLLRRVDLLRLYEARHLESM